MAYESTRVDVTVKPHCHWLDSVVAVQLDTQLKKLAVKMSRIGPCVSSNVSHIMMYISAQKGSFHIHLFTDKTPTGQI